MLIVEAEVAVHHSVEPILSDRRGQWNVTFAKSAAAAIDLIASKSFDVVISDLHLSGKRNGVELLMETRARLPHSARILFSSYSDQRSALQHAGLVHQFLPKPCPPEWIQSSIERIAMIHSLLPDPAVRRAISSLERVVSLPSLYLQLLRQIQSVETAIDDIAETVSQDVGMTAQVLKLVNSAFFGLPQPTSDMAQAVSFLGIDTLKYLVLALGVFAQFEDRELGGLTLEALWSHSVRTAHAAKFIAKQQGAKREVVEDAMAAGLLHDLGKLVLASHFPDKCEQAKANAIEHEAEWLVEERALFGFDHADVAGYLLGLWGLPLSVLQAVAFHHLPGNSGTDDFTALTAVHAANVIVQSRGRANGGIPPPQADGAYLSKIGLVSALELWTEALELAPSV